MKNLMLLDGNSLLYAAQDSPPLTCRGMEVQAIYGGLRKIRSLIESYPTYLPVCLWDGKAKFRFDLYPEYKGNRVATEEQKAMKASVKAQRPYLVKLLASMGVMQIAPKFAEADDIAAKIVGNVDLDINRILLITGDRDWWQLIDTRTRWMDVRKEGRLVTHETFTEHALYQNARQFVEAKACQGDPSDNIPPIGGVGPEACLQIFDRAPSVETFLSKKDWGKLPKKLQDFLDNATPKPSTKWGDMPPMQDAFRRNLQLVDLSIERDLGPINTVRNPPSVTTFTEQCKDLNFASILRDRTWHYPFLKNFDITKSHSLVL